MSAMGVKIDLFDVPVCNSFEAKIMNDQLCYEVDLNIFTNKGNIEKELKSGFAFIIDYNEDRQFTFDMEDMSEKDEDLVSKIVKSDDKGHAYIYLNTIRHKPNLSSHHMLRHATSSSLCLHHSSPKYTD